MAIEHNVKARDLALGDVVRVLLGDDPFADAVVVNITATEVHLFRPYVQTSEFSYTGGVIPYIGIEQFAISLGRHSVTRLKKAPPKL